jgi:hypothetical protein
MISSLKYLPEYLQTNATMVELCDNIDWIENRQYGEFNDVKNKYKDVNEISIDASKEISDEFGYGYILDVLNLTEAETASIVGYLNIIHALKGSKPGLELVFSLFGLEYDMKEWWETVPKGTPTTFGLTIEYEPEQLKPDTQGSMEVFIRNYVYPLCYYKLYYRTNLFQNVGIQALTSEITTIYPRVKMITPNAIENEIAYNQTLETINIPSGDE